MALDQESFNQVLKALIQEFEKGEFSEEDLRIAIQEEAFELVESLNSRDVARPEYSHGGDR
jgi:NTP pyrophosphatase (non-canonical NTP hydrolase)